MTLSKSRDKSDKWKKVDIWKRNKQTLIIFNNNQKRVQQLLTLPLEKIKPNLQEKKWSIKIGMSKKIKIVVKSE